VLEFSLYLFILVSNKKQHTIKRGGLSNLDKDLFQSHIHILPPYITITQIEESLACWGNGLLRVFYEIGT
jgi:hypothetical protein